VLSIPAPDTKTGGWKPCWSRIPPFEQIVTSAACSGLDPLRWEQRLAQLAGALRCSCLEGLIGRLKRSPGGIRLHPWRDCWPSLAVMLAMFQRLCDRCAGSGGS